MLRVWTGIPVLVPAKLSLCDVTHGRKICIYDVKCCMPFSQQKQQLCTSPVYICKLLHKNTFIAMLQNNVCFVTRYVQFHLFKTIKKTIFLQNDVHSYSRKWYYITVCKLKKEEIRENKGKVRVRKSRGKGDTVTRRER